MKNIIASTALLSVIAMPALAQDSGALKLGVTGHFMMYGNYTSQDEIPGGVGVHKVDILRDVDIGVAGETTLDNGLTVGAVVNADGDVGDGFEVEDSFVYASNNYGRLSIGVEDSASFQLQVAAPSADENVDGLEAFISPVNWAATSLAGSNFEASASANGADVGFDYDNAGTSGYDKITYMTPVFDGFQAGISYTPDTTADASRGANGNTLKVDDDYADAWDVGARYEREFETWKLTAGAGLTHINLENQVTAGLDDFNEWNTGLNLGFGDFSVGAVYTQNNGGETDNADQKTFVLGTDYTVGDLRYGASWLNRRVEEGGAGTTDANRYTGGVVYTYGPGMSFRASVSYVDVSAPAAVSDDVNATSVLLGTQINF